MMSLKNRYPALILLTVAFAGTTLAFDLSAPMGVAAGLPYVAAVLIAVWLDWTLAPLVLATAGTALTIVGYLFAPETENNLALVINRGWAIFVIWATAIVLYMRNQAEESAREAARDKELILNSAVDGIIGVNPAAMISLANDAAAHMLGWRIKDLIGQPLCRVTHWIEGDRPDPEVESSPIYQAINEQAAFAGDDQTFRRKDGSTLPVTLSIKLRKKMNGEPSGAVLVFQDRTAHEERDQQLRQLATQDALTGLRNRRYLFSAAAYEFDRWVRTDEPLSLLTIDVDRFKELNDEFGHEGGDEVLKTAARILKHQTRRIDIVSRMGNGEFAVLLPATRLAGARTLAERIRGRCENFKLPYAGRTLDFSVSVGAVEVAGSFANLDEFVSAGEQALEQAKAAGGNQTATAFQVDGEHGLQAQTA